MNSILDFTLSQASQVCRNIWNVPPPEIGKTVVEIWCYLPEVYTLGEESEIQEIFSKKCEKSRFSFEILIKKSQNFLHFVSKRARFCRRVAYFYLPNGNHASNLDDLAFFYKFQPIFSKLFKKFHAIFNSPSLCKLFLSFFDKFLDQIG